MDLLTVLVLAVALAMDAFAVAIATGLCLQQVSLRQTFRLAWHFGLFQAGMPVIGWFLGLTVRSFVQAWAHWVAFGLLLFIGLRMIRESLQQQEREKRCDPTKGGSLVMLSIATSIDALAAGLSLSMLGVSVWFPALVIGVVCLLVTAAGLHMGRLASRWQRLAQWAEALGGAGLVLIGVNILRQAGVFG